MKTKKTRVDIKLIFSLALAIGSVMGLCALLGSQKADEYLRKEAKNSLKSNIEIASISAVALLWSLDVEGLRNMAASFLKADPNIVYVRIDEGSTREEASLIAEKSNLPESVDPEFIKSSDDYLFHTERIVKKGVNEDGSEHLGFMTVAMSLKESQVFREQLQVSLLIATLLLILIIAIILKVMTQVIVRTPIEQLMRSAEQIARGDLEHEPSSQRSDEIGQLGQAFDAMRIKLKTYIDSINELNRDLESLVEQKAQKIKSILSNIELGIFTVGKGLAIQEEYAKYLETIFDQKKIAGVNAVELCFDKSSISDNDRDQIKEALNLCIGEDLLNFECNAHLLPKEIVVDVTGKKKHLSCDWNPILAGNNVERMIVTLKDMTTIRELQQKYETSRSEMAIISEMLNLDPSRFQMFIQACCNKLASVRLLSSHEQVVDLGKIFILIHTIKGNARMLNLTLIVDASHRFETLVKRMQTGEEDYSDTKLIVDLEHLSDAVNRYQHLYETRLDRVNPSDNNGRVDLALDVMDQLLKLDEKKALAGFSFVKAILEDDYIGLSETVNDLKQSVFSIAKQLGKERPQIITNLEYTLIDRNFHSQLNDFIGHLLRNAVDHGFEFAEERSRLGKKLEGTIRVYSRFSGRQVSLFVEDDGKGLDLDRIRQKAIDLKVIEKDAA